MKRIIQFFSLSDSGGDINFTIHGWGEADYVIWPDNRFYIVCTKHWSDSPHRGTGKGGGGPGDKWSMSKHSLSFSPNAKSIYLFIPVVYVCSVQCKVYTRLHYIQFLLLYNVSIYIDICIIYVYFIAGHRHPKCLSGTGAKKNAVLRRLNLVPDLFQHRYFFFISVPDWSDTGKFGISTFRYLNIHIRIHLLIVHMHMHVYLNIYVYVHIWICTCTHKHLHITISSTYVYINIFIYIYIHTYIYYTYIHGYIWIYR
jgi:hypothetical protein